MKCGLDITTILTFRQLSIRSMRFTSLKRGRYARSSLGYAKVQNRAKNSRNGMNFAVKVRNRPLHALMQ